MKKAAMRTPKLMIGGIVMASGMGQRFQKAAADRGSSHTCHKLLADFCGAPLITSVLRTVSTPLLDRKIVVTRNAGIWALCNEAGIPGILHEQPLLSDTIRIGLNALLYDPEETAADELLRTPAEAAADELLHTPAEAAASLYALDGCLFLQADQPLLSPQSIEALILAFRQNPHFIYRLSWQGNPGSPVLFPKTLFSGLLNLPPDCGGNAVIRRYPELVRLVEARHAWELADVDTPAALDKLREIAIHNKI